MIENDPWPHLIKDNFFSSEILNKIQNEYGDREHGDYWVTYTDSVSQELHEVTKDLWTYRKQLEENRQPNVHFRNRMLCGQRYSFFRILVKVMDPGTSHGRIHRDADWKQMTTIVYVSKESTGTLLYKTNEPNSFVKEIPWKQNRAYSFIPSDTSYHDFKHSDNHNKKRIVVQFTLCNKTYYR
jgi:hypothetical protein